LDIKAQEAELKAQKNKQDNIILDKMKKGQIKANKQLIAISDVAKNPIKRTQEQYYIKKLLV